MLTAAIVSSDAASAAQLVASLQQTGFVNSVRKWSLPTDTIPESGENIPDVVLLDLAQEPEIFFTFAANLRRLRPSTRLIACSEAAPSNPQLLLDAMRSGVQDFISKPVNPAELKEILDRLKQEGHAANGKGAEKLIAVMGSKGGVGATTVAVNLAVQFCTHSNKRTVLLDFGRPLGNVHLLLDLHPRFGIRDAIENLDRLDSHFFGGLLDRHKTKLEVLGGALQPEEWQDISTAPLDRVVNVAQAGFEIVVADLGSHFSSDLIPVLKAARMVLIVVEANVPSLWTFQRRMLALTGSGIETDRVRVIVNRWHKGDEEALKSIEKDTRRPVFACLPNDFRKANSASNQGLPLMENHNNSLADQYRRLAEQLAGEAAVNSSAPKRGGLGNFLFPTKR